MGSVAGRTVGDALNDYFAGKDILVEQGWWCKNSDSVSAAKKKLVLKSHPAGPTQCVDNALLFTSTIHNVCTHIIMKTKRKMQRFGKIFIKLSRELKKIFLWSSTSQPQHILMIFLNFRGYSALIFLHSLFL